MVEERHIEARIKTMEDLKSGKAIFSYEEIDCKTCYWKKSAYYLFYMLIIMCVVALPLAFWVYSLQIELEQEEQTRGNFVDRFMEIPYNQGLYTGMATTFYELKNQGFDLNSSDLNTESLSPEYYAIMGSLIKEHGSDSVSCWLIDTGAMYSADKSEYDCSIYEQELKRAKELLKS